VSDEVLYRWPAPAPEVARLLAHAQPDDRPFVLASGPGDPALSSWSYVGLEALAQHSTLEQAWPTLTGWSSSGEPPFTGGLVGYLGYDQGWAYVKRPRPPRLDPLGLPNAAIFSYDAIYARHEPSGVGYVCAQPNPEARRRAERLQALLSEATPTPQGSLRTPLQARISEEQYRRRVAVLLDAIAAGELYQANLSYGVEGRYAGDPVATFLRVLESPPPFAAFLGLGAGQTIVSASPECFFDLEGPSRRISAYPIKGTRGRSVDRELDHRLAEELVRDPKERAEHLMIVDLLRNDLGRIALPGSVQVNGLAYVESFPTVHHLTSRVQANLPPQLPVNALWSALFPGGSITGAPKLRSMELIDELEGEARGVYTGSIFYAGADGSLRSNIAIRTASFAGEWVRFGVGGGIVADSRPEQEWEETKLKAKALSRALRGE
jgi:para-aminobenzoate synthetase component 1